MPYLGEIRIFAGTREPSDWLFCDGRALDLMTYLHLYNAIGNMYGGDGQNNFNLPDLRGRIVLGVHQGGPPYYDLGQMDGQATVTLDASTMPTHTHRFNASSQMATSLAPGPNVGLATVTNDVHLYDDTTIATKPATTFNAKAIGANAGGGMPHENLMPSVVINHIICFNGVFPQ
jgi:microcystin-dependent protein